MDRQDFTKGVGFIDAVVKKALSNDTIEVWGDGEVIRDYIYIDDVCKMLYALAQYEGDEVIFNISSGTGTSQNEIIKIVERLNKNTHCIYKEGRSVDAKSIILDNSKIREIFKDEILGIEEGISNYYNFLKW